MPVRAQPLERQDGHHHLEKQPQEPQEFIRYLKDILQKISQSWSGDLHYKVVKGECTIMQTMKARRKSQITQDRRLIQSGPDTGTSPASMTISCHPPGKDDGVARIPLKRIKIIQNRERTIAATVRREPTPEHLQRQIVNENNERSSCEGSTSVSQAAGAVHRGPRASPVRVTKCCAPLKPSNV